MLDSCHCIQPFMDQIPSVLLLYGDNAFERNILANMRADRTASLIFNAHITYIFNVKQRLVKADKL